MRTLFRFIALCLSLFYFGFLNQNIETGKGYAVTGGTSLSAQVYKQKAATIFCEIESETTFVNAINSQDLNPDSIDFTGLLYLFSIYILGLCARVSFWKGIDLAAFLQQQRAKYLLYHSLKIPHQVI